MAGRGTDIILGGVPDNRMKAILLEDQLDPETAPAEARQLAAEQALSEMAGDYKKALGERRLDPDAKKTLAKRYLGLLASFAMDHPAVLSMLELTPQCRALLSYLDSVRALARPTKEKIARSFYPTIEDPVDFLAVHPLRASIEAVAASAEIQKVTDFLERSERERVVALGGLHILATERHEARRIDNQLRGRAGRQGDPGSSRFYLSLEDDLMRIFGSDRISGLMLKLGMEEGVPIEHGMVTRSIERAQKQVEAQNFAVRKHLLEYDDVMNKQRTAVYDMRRMVLEGKDAREYILNLSREVLDWYLDSYCGEKLLPEHWNLEGLSLALKETFGIHATLDELKAMGRDELRESLGSRIQARFEEKERQTGAELLLLHSRLLMLQIVDTQWKDHLYSLDHLKEGIGLRGYGQRDPLVEYKKESFSMFQALMDRIDEEILRWIFLYQAVPMPPEEAAGPHNGDSDPTPELSRRGPRRPTPPPVHADLASGDELGAGFGARAGARAMPRNLSFNDPSDAPSAFARAEPEEAKGGGDTVQTVRREGKKVGRNDRCPCGSGKKYKKCHGAN
jgi:preprotein translocase subunit SecA